MSELAGPTFLELICQGRTTRAHGAILDNFPCQGVVLTQIREENCLFWLEFFFGGYTSQLMNHCLDKDFI